jgi:acetolactate synthase-1/2/3 large subunit
MNIDHQALFRAVTKATFRLSAGNAREVINESLMTAKQEYPGPVHIGLPSDLAGRSVADNPETVSTAARPRQGHFDERVRVLLASSRRPLIAAGLTAARTGVGEALGRFLATCKVPVVLTPMAKGLLPDGHPCYAGVLFHALSDKLKRLTQEADLIIGLGYDPVEYNYESWLPKVPLVHFDTREADMLPAGAMQVIAEQDRWFELLASLASSPDMISLADEVHEEIAKELNTAARGFTPVTALSLLQDILPGDTIVTADVGSHLHLLGQMWNVKGNGRLIMTNGWSSMGFGLPAAIASALEYKDRPVVCVTGDGGILMNAGEIITGRRLGLKIIIVVLADGELNLIRLKESWKKIKPYGTELYKGSLFGSGKFLGADVLQASDSRSMRSAIRRALLSDKSVIIEAAVDPAVYSDLIVKS